jgi:hypothetical protein
MSRVYLLGGRTFAPTEHLTSRQDGYMIVQAQDSGLFDLLAKVKADADDETAKILAADLIVAAHRTSTFHAIIAGRLVEEGKTWNAKDAAANAEFFADLSAPDEKAQLSTAFVEVLQDFFLSAARSLTPTATSSPTAATSTEANSPSVDDNSTSPPVATAGPSARASSRRATATA